MYSTNYHKSSQDMGGCTLDFLQGDKEKFQCSCRLGIGGLELFKEETCFIYAHDF